jgi:hypothetical protein
MKLWKADSYPIAYGYVMKENSQIVKTYYYWQMGKLYIGGVPLDSGDPWLNSILCSLLKKRPSDGFVKTEIILT